MRWIRFYLEIFQILNKYKSANKTLAPTKVRCFELV